MFYWLIFLLGALVLPSAYSAECTATSFFVSGSFRGGNGGGSGSSRAAACNAMATAIGISSYYGATAFTGVLVGAGCTLSGPDGDSSAFQVQGDASCTQPPPPSQCSANKGKTSIVNRTVGFTRSSDDNDFAVVGGVTKSATGALICHNGCASEIQPFSSTTDGAGAFRSLVPNAQGLYRMSLDLPVTNSGSDCAPGAEGSAVEKAAQNPLTPSPPCPGYVGEVNGKKGCYGTAERPVVTAPAERPPVPNEGGNPAAGERPASGEGAGAGGTGRTPNAGTGDNDGGPSSAATAGRPSGTASAPAAGTEQLNCGAPGQPKCRIDESGTGDGKGAFNEAEEKTKTTKDAIKTAIDGAANIEAPKWTFSFAFPTGCTPYTTAIRGFVMNPCAYQSTIHDLMSMIWAAVSAFCIIGMVGRTIRES